MKNFHPTSFILGLVSGILILFLFVGGKHLLWPSTQTGTVTGREAFQQGGGAGANTSRMAQRLGMTEDELKKELASGKTFQEIAKEKGVTLGVGRGQTGSGTAFPGTSSGSISSQKATSAPSSSK